MTEYKDDMNYKDCVTECAMNETFVREFNRLSGTTINFKDTRKPIEIMIDKACGYDNPYRNKPEEMQKFFDFVLEFIWIPLLQQG
jgi:hypothetical protein